MKKLITQKQPEKIEIETTTDLIISPVFEKKNIPTIKFNTNKLDGLNDKIQSLKINNYQSDFISEIHKVLDLYDDSELKYNEKLVLFVMNEVENYILKPKSGKYKSELVVESVKKYFNYDDELVILVIKLVFDKLTQVKFIRRQGLKVLRFFLTKWV
jgi:hypothetical protein